jgi:hypothetical protein
MKNLQPPLAPYRTKYIKKDLDPAQRLQLDCALHGLKACSPSYIKTLSEEEKRTIVYKHEKAWKIINQLKQQYLNSFLRHVLNQLAPEMNGCSVNLLVDDIYDANFIVEDIHELKIDESIIIRALITAGILPENFYQ